MTNLIFEWCFNHQVSPALAQDSLDAAGDHYATLPLRWENAYLAVNGRAMVAHAVTPALTDPPPQPPYGAGSALCPWSASVHLADTSDAPNVLVERTFDSAVTLDAIQAIEDAGISCLEMRGVKFIQTFFSLDRTRMLCLYKAPDAESVRSAQSEARVPYQRVWSYNELTIVS